MNKLMPGSVKKIDRKGSGFALMQNIERFNKAAEKYGVPVRELFQTVDLWEKKNIPAVTLCLFALAREVSDRSVTGQIYSRSLYTFNSFLTGDDTRSFCGQCRSRSHCTERVV